MSKSLKRLLRRLHNHQLWFTHDMVFLKGEVYLERWVLSLLGFTIRLHKFYRGDDERAPHDHPWPFVTIPLTGYWEEVFWETGESGLRHVRAFWPHHRPSRYRHIVKGTSMFVDGQSITWLTPRPFYTIVVAGRKDRSWGFYLDGKYVYYRNFK